MADPRCHGLGLDARCPGCLDCCGRESCPGCAACDDSRDDGASSSPEVSPSAAGAAGPARAAGVGGGDASAPAVRCEPPTLRDRFAMAALSGIIASQTDADPDGEEASGVAVSAYFYADAMLYARTIDCCCARCGAQRSEHPLTGCAEHIGGPDCARGGK